ncbi:hypothetical protein E0Z10_g8807 [Xylaria hypoxylon]|uniref:Protein kinase domain-containing protein n=1 Tax=Xylaria hypoxylon TaxID=37992 RepID=A0A4Z0YQX8_9PEZI|nr:hypothetical protein E0Z10_g8807 [Xylaria hypoxylon]
MAWTPSTDAKMDARQNLYQKMANYREGREIEIDDYVYLPKSGDPPEVVYPGVIQTAHAYLLGRRDKMNIDEITDERLLPEKYRKAWRHSQILKQHFVNEYPKLQYKKCLGWGGNGMAAAFDDLDENGHKDYRNSEHIVQLLYKNGEGLLDNNNNTDDGPSTSAGQKRSDPFGNQSPKRAKTGRPTLNCFITEMLDNGDLSRFICKVQTHDEIIPNAVLWRFFLCFIKMCIGLAYPPASIDERKNITPPVPEKIVHSAQPKRVVHFDFDPRNVFVGDVGQGPEHDLTPLLKLGDFGLATEIYPGRSDFYYEILRLHGKRGFYAPEQFCADWDYILPDTFQISSHSIAGNYGVHTNVWAVGYIMECLITLCLPANPPLPTEITRLPPAGKTKYWSYGGHLQQDIYSYVDPDLVSVIMRCQAHHPADRPSLEHLEQVALSLLERKGTFGRSEQDLKQWMNKILDEPPPNVDTSHLQMARPVIKRPAEILGYPPDLLHKPFLLEALYLQGLSIPEALTLKGITRAISLKAVTHKGISLKETSLKVGSLKVVSPKAAFHKETFHKETSLQAIFLRVGFLKVIILKVIILKETSLKVVSRKAVSRKAIISKVIILQETSPKAAFPKVALHRETFLKAIIFQVDSLKETSLKVVSLKAIISKVIILQGTSPKVFLKVVSPKETSLKVVTHKELSIPQEISLPQEICLKETFLKAMHPKAMHPLQVLQKRVIKYRWGVHFKNDHL